MQMYIVACSLEARTLFPLKTVRDTFLYWTIIALLYVDNFFHGTMGKELGKNSL